MRKYTAPTAVESKGSTGRDAITYNHPSFGLIIVTRQSSSVPESLFGSSLGHRTIVPNWSVT